MNKEKTNSIDLTDFIKLWPRMNFKLKFGIQRGMSLIEIMVVMAILSFVSLAITSTLTDIIKMQNSTVAKDESNEFGAALGRFLFTEATCTAALSGQQFPLNGQRTLTLPGYVGYGSPDVGLQLQSNTQVGNKLTVVSLELSDRRMPLTNVLYNGVMTRRALAQVSLVTQTTGGLATAPRNFEFPILIEQATNRIIRCMSGPTPKDACIASGGRFNDATQECTDECVFEGNYSQTTCSPVPRTTPCPTGQANPQTGGFNCPSGASTARQTGQFATTFAESCGKKCTTPINVRTQYFICLRCN